MRIKFNVHEDYMDSVKFFSYAFDNASREIPLITEYDGENLHIRIILDGIFRPEFPVIIDPTISMYSLTQDCYISTNNNVYLTAWNYSFGSISNNTISIVGQRLTLGQYYIYRDFMYFNTNNIIPNGATILSASIYIYVTFDRLGTRRLVIQYNNNNNASPHNPPIIYDYNRTNYSFDGGSKTGFSTFTFNSIPLNNTGISWINRTGLTKFCLRTSTDISGTAPTGNERLNFYSANQGGTSNDPYLEIVFRIYVNTSLNPVVYIQTGDSVSITSNIDIHTNSIDIYYRYADFNSLYDLSDAFFNLSYIDNTCNPDNKLTFSNILSGGYYQVFKTSDAILLRNISCIVNESLDADADGILAIYTLTVDYYLDSEIGYSDSINEFSNIPSMTTFEFYPYISLDANTNYAIIFNFATFRSFPNPAPPPNEVYLWYNISDTYDNGFMAYYNGAYPPTYTFYYDYDFPFIINYSWIYYDNIVYPFSFDFNNPKGNNIYRLVSQGMNTSYPDDKETINDNYDIEFLYAFSPIQGENDNWLYLGEVLSLDNTQFYLIILLSVWLYLIGIWAKETDRGMIFGIIQLFIGLPLSFIIIGIAYYQTIYLGYLIGGAFLFTTVFIPIIELWRK